MSLKDTIISSTDYNLTEINVEEWGATVFIKPLSGMVRNKLIQDVRNNKDLDKIQLRVIINCLCDATGNLIFEEKDLNALGQKNAEVLSRIENICCKISGLNTEGKEDIEKN